MEVIEISNERSIPTNEFRLVCVCLDPVIPMYYAPDGEDGYTQAPVGPLFLWGQAVFIIAQLLTSGLLHINELDTIRRYLPSYNRPRKGGRYSAFQVNVNLRIESGRNILIVQNCSTKH